ncbi:MAG TPA: DNA-processing protein DprA [Candidatus Limnocylindrales bacterium]|nr:DNA-processing protein DprA [Candidatus Limnocylindrales bacterium]
MRRSLDERTAWIVLASVTGVGPQTFAELVGAAGGASAVLTLARHGRLARLARATTPPRLTSAVVEAIETTARSPGAVIDEIGRYGLWTLVPLDPEYPRRLRDLDPPPPVLFGRGDRHALAARRAVAVVGTRRPTATGRLLAGRIVTALSAHGAVVISGMAIGIDGSAHAAAVDCRSPTVAVLGSGHAHPGPRAHGTLLEAMIAGGGAVVSELRPEIVATRGTFPRRNRVIAALADAVIVVEAPFRSGALITARHGLELGRAVFAAPGRPGDPATGGCLALLRETPAQPFVGEVELLADLGYLAETGAASVGGGVERTHGDTPAGGQALEPEVALAALAGPERIVAERICAGPVTGDGLVVGTGLPPGVVSGALTLLQLRGWIRTMGPAYLAAGPLLGVSRTPRDRAVVASARAPLVPCPGRRGTAPEEGARPCHPPSRTREPIARGGTQPAVRHRPTRPAR